MVSNMLYGLLNLSFWGYVVATLLMTQITIAAVTIYLHRHQAHRALNLHPIVSHFFRFWLWLSTGMVTKEWVAIHRKHHAFTETEQDPHSPQVKGIKKVLLEGAELYKEEANNQETVEKYSHGTPDDWVERNVYARSGLGILLMFFIDLLFFGVPGITIWACQMIWIPLFAAGVVNGIGHYWGYRNFECPDAARNIVPWGIFLGGEELHNNHHAFASSAKLSAKWWEIDMGYVYIRILSFFHLAKIKKLPPRLAKVPGKSTVDLDTVKALFSNRFQILANYYKDVVSPVFEEEKHRANDASQIVYKRARKLLIREKSVMSRQAKSRLALLLKQENSLKLVYQYRLKLQAIWTKTASSQKELVESLQQWCKQAEATGIESLMRFAENLKSYVNAVVVP